MQRMNGKSTSSRRSPVAVREVSALKRFKDLMKKNAGKLRFVGHGE